MLRPIQLLLVGCVAFVGCGGTPGPTLYEVSGRLTKGGQPLSNVSVTFSPVDSSLPSSAGVTDNEGKFTLQTQTGESGAVAGSHKVILGVATSTGTFDPARELAAREGQQTPGQRNSLPTGAAPELPFPSDYTSGDTTPKQVEVTAGSDNQIEIDISE